jgi:hypothetical protein
MRFSWKALLLAPLPVPFLASLALMIMAGANNLLYGFLIFFALGSIFSYGVTLFGFLPALFILSLYKPLSRINTTVLGTLLGAVSYIPFILVEYQASGVDSGPPTITFVEYVLRQLTSCLVIGLLFSIGGLVTAVVYWKLSEVKTK